MLLNNVNSLNSTERYVHLKMVKMVNFIVYFTTIIFLFKI